MVQATVERVERPELPNFKPKLTAFPYNGLNETGNALDKICITRKGGRSLSQKVKAVGRRK